MEFITFGSTGLRVSVAGLGCGGHSRLGTAQGKSMAHGATIVRAALDLGINFIDTAAAYGTEPAVGEGIAGRRDDVVISTKAGISRSGDNIPTDKIVASLENSLRELQTDYIDIFNLHGVTLADYDHAVTEVLPELKRQQSLGKIRFLGITEAFIRDPEHLMLQRALPDDHFDVVMVGFNLLNPSARHRVFPITQEKGVATQIMFAVRRALSQPEALEALMAELSEAGVIKDIDPAHALDFIVAHPEVASLVQAAYRFCRHEPGADVVLTGTGSADHLAENVASILAPPLAPELLDELQCLFGHIDCVSGN